eukprot:TRINITY_DN13730_c0_g1_i1.p3 TRINITY_DN13730_c0_g1~~TRINITY_DN13730_c0_g1_i1.p3  ORF type:complete len:104 (+),score=2.27 TRINITY_DN13730_c0_g1_i1:98-409(+)
MTMSWRGHKQNKASLVLACAFKQLIHGIQLQSKTRPHLNARLDNQSGCTIWFGPELHRACASFSPHRRASTVVYSTPCVAFAAHFFDGAELLCAPFAPLLAEV